MSRSVSFARTLAVLVISGLIALAGVAPGQDSKPGLEAGPKSGVDLDALDRNTRPQDDFFQFANGGWLDKTEIPAIYSGYSVYHQVFEDTEEALQKIIEAAGANPGPHGSESQKVGDLFASWMDEEKIDSLGVGAVAHELSIVGGVTDLSSLSRAFAEFERIGVGTPYDISVFADLKNSSINAVYLSQDGLTLPDRDYYLDLDNENFDKARNALPGYIQSMLMAAGQSEAEAAAAAKVIYEMETEIAAAHWDKVKNRDLEAGYNPHAVADLDTLGTSLDWGVTRKVLGVEGADTLIVFQPSYFIALNGMLESRSVDDWKNYLTFRVMDARGQNLDSATAEIRFDFRNRTLRGQQEPRPRWKRGISLINGIVGEAVGKLYVAEYFPPEAKTKMEELVANVLTTLETSLDDLDWMSTETKERARGKLARFTPKIGYPDVWKDYSTMEIVRGDHMANLRSAIEWDYQRDIAKVGGPVDKTEWHMSPQTVNAYYSPTQNEIVFPAARLQPPFFQLWADDAINYGAVGGVIGHEISHGFDDQGSRFDGDGNMNNWWTDADREAFEERTKKLIEQYNEFSPIEGMFVNGEFTLGENIGDLSGVAMAYRAYMRSLDGKEPPVIDGFTGPQRFFIGYAMSRRGKNHDETTISRLASDPHSPLKYRVIGPYRNIDAFHEAFDTSEGDGMWLPPDERVRIW